MAIQNIYPGWLPYGSDDDSVLFYHPLTSDPSTTDIPSSTKKTVGSPIFDENGMNPNGGDIEFEALTNGDDLDNGGQVTFEVERKFICINDATRGSVADTLPSTMACFGFTPTASSDFNIYFVQRGTAATSGPILRTFGDLSVNENPYDSTVTAATLQLHSIGKSDYVRINIGWTGGITGGRIYYAIDGLLLAVGTRALTSLSALKANMYIGARSAGGDSMDGYYIRNLQVSIRPPTFPVHPKLAKVVMWGDSQVKDLDAVNGVEEDNRPALSFLREMQKKGFYTGDIVTASYAGESFATSADHDDFLAQGRVTSLAAEKPTLILIRAGTNDCNNSTFSASTFQTEVASMIDTMLAWDSAPEIVLAAVPSAVAAPSTDTATWRANRASINSAYEIIASTRAKVHYIDSYTYLGGENPEDYTYIGQYSSENLHFGPRGGYLQGKHYAQSVLENVLK